MRRAAFAILGLLVLCPATASATAKRTAASKVSNCSSVRAHAVAVDAQARQAGLDPPARDALRQAQAKPLIAELKSRIEAARCGALPKSLLAKACAYTLNLWGRLMRFLEHPQVELSTNLAENSMRPVALGRRESHLFSCNRAMFSKWRSRGWVS